MDGFAPVMTVLAEQIAAVEAAASPLALLEAVRALAATDQPEAVPTLIRVLGYNNPGAAVAAVAGLVRQGEVAVEPLLNLLDGYNYGARAWGIRALAQIGDPRALETLLKAATADFALSVRRAATYGLGTLRWQTVADPVAAQQQIVTAFVTTSQDAEWVVRYATAAALAAFQGVTTLPPEQLEPLWQRLAADPELVVRARVEIERVRA